MKGLGIWGVELWAGGDGIGAVGLGVKKLELGA